MKSINIAIVGLGSIAEYHLRSFGKLAGVHIQAVASRNKEKVARVKREYAIDEGFSRYEDLLAGAAADAVVICTPSDLHFEMARQGLCAGKHVLVEKPLAQNLAEVQALCRLAEEKGRVLMAAMTARFTPQYLEAWRSVRRGEIGEVIQVIVRWLENKTIGVNWEGKRVPVDKRTSTVLYHHGSHMLDAALWFAAGTPTDVYAVGARHQTLNDDVAVLIKTGCGKLITAVHSFNSPQKLHDLVLLGTKGIIEIKSYEKLRINGKQRLSTTWEKALACGVDNQADEFCRSIRENCPPIASGAELLPAFMALERAYQLLESQGIA